MIELDLDDPNLNKSLNTDCLNLNPNNIGPDHPTRFGLYFKKSDKAPVRPEAMNWNVMLENLGLGFDPPNSKKLELMESGGKMGTRECQFFYLNYFKNT